jgi:hypothetical protein
MTEVKEIMDMITKDTNVQATVLMSGTFSKGLLLYIFVLLTKF